jgi:hypothetical protein
LHVDFLAAKQGQGQAGIGERDLPVGKLLRQAEQDGTGRAVIHRPLAVLASQPAEGEVRPQTPGQEQEWKGEQNAQPADRLCPGGGQRLRQRGQDTRQDRQQDAEAQVLIKNVRTWWSNSSVLLS